MTQRPVAMGLMIFIAVWLFVSSLAFAQDRQIRRNPQRESATLNSDRKIALVIGNGAYADSPLRNSVNDARAVARVLKELGFDTDEKTNVPRDRMMEAVDEFGKRLRLGGVGLFYFSGHGVQVNGENYLIPVGSGIEFEEHVRYRAVNVGEILGAMENAKNPLNIVILDACRNNPFKRSFRSSSLGLAMINAPTGSLIAYSTAPGSLASDGDDKYGLYTQELLENMRVPGLKIEEMFKRVRKALQEKTNGKQVPWESSSLVGDFYFKPMVSSELDRPGSAPAGIKEEKSQAQSSSFQNLPTSPKQGSPTADDFKPKESLYASVPPASLTPATPPKPQIDRPAQESKLKLGIFPWILTGRTAHHIHNILDTVTGSLATKASFDISFNDYRGNPEKVWTRKNAWSASEPDVPAIQQKGMALGVEAVLLYSINVSGSERDIHAYLVDVSAGKLYSLRDFKSFGVGGNAFDSLEETSLKLFREFELNRQRRR